MALKFLLDTNVCIAFLDGDSPKLRDRWLATPSEDLALCSVVKAELFHGAFASRDPLGNRARLERFFSAFASVPFDDRAAELYGEILASLGRSGKQIGMADTLIAAISLAQDLTLVTRNGRHFKRVPGLRVVSW